MAKRTLMDQLNDAVDAILAHPDAAVSVDAQLEPLVQLATHLRDLPDQTFKQRLRTSLEERRNTNMQVIAKKDVKFPEGYHTITPYLVLNEAAEVIEFVKKAFGAQEMFRTTGEAGGIHCEIRIGDSMMMIGGGGKWQGTPNPTALHLFVEDVDEVYKRAVEAGGKGIVEPADHEYGERVAQVNDVAGNEWYIARSLEGTYVPDVLRNVNVYFHPKDTAAFIDFLNRAFGAEEVVRHHAPDGTVVHAKIRIGDSIVEMGEAHEIYQPLPTTLYLYVDDCDAWYQRALQAGAVSVSEPKDQAYGDRSAGVRDPFGNTWYVATPLQR